MTSIAVSAVLRPSPSLRLLVLTASLIAGVVALLVAAGALGAMALAPRIALASACSMAAGVGFLRVRRLEKSYRVDISGAGQIRLAVLLAQVGADANNCVASIDNECAEVVRLLDGSTLWPHLLMLRLQTADGRIHTLVALPDSVAPATFKALAVACRWIAAHRQGAETKIF